MIDHSYSKYSSLYGSGGSWGGARGGWPLLLLDQTEARRAEKKILGRQPPPLTQGLNDQAPPPLLSEGLDPSLYGALRLNRCLSQPA